MELWVVTFHGNFSHSGGVFSSSGEAKAAAEMGLQASHFGHVGWIPIHDGDEVRDEYGVEHLVNSYICGWEIAESSEHNLKGKASIRRHILNELF